MSLSFIRHQEFNLEMQSHRKLGLPTKKLNLDLK